MLCEPNLHAHNSMMSVLELPDTHSQLTQYVASACQSLVTPLVLMPRNLRSSAFCLWDVVSMPTYTEATAMNMLAHIMQPGCQIFTLDSHGIVQGRRAYCVHACVRACVRVCVYVCV